jgi:hypothetical protein
MLGLEQDPLLADSRIFGYFQYLEQHDQITFNLRLREDQQQDLEQHSQIMYTLKVEQGRNTTSYRSHTS